jgi:hypothetical protein
MSLKTYHERHTTFCLKAVIVLTRSIRTAQGVPIWCPSRIDEPTGEPEGYDRPAASRSNVASIIASNQINRHGEFDESRF